MNFDAELKRKNVYTLTTRYMVNMTRYEIKYSIAQSRLKLSDKNKVCAWSEPRTTYNQIIPL